MNLVGWIGALALMICGIPLAVRAIQDGHADGVDGHFLFLWTLGEIASLAYVIYLGDLPLTINYVANTGACLVLCYYRWRPR